MYKVILLSLSLWVLFLISCEEQTCESVSEFYPTDTFAINIHDTVYTAFNHGIRVDTILPGFVTIDTTEVESPDDPNQTVIKYDTTIFDAQVSFSLFNELINIKDSVVLSVGDTLSFGKSDLEKDYSLISLHFMEVDSINLVHFIIFEGVLYQDCSQW